MVISRNPFFFAPSAIPRTQAEFCPWLAGQMKFLGVRKDQCMTPLMPIKFGLTIKHSWRGGQNASAMVELRNNGKTGIGSYRGKPLKKGKRDVEFFHYPGLRQTVSGRFIRPHPDRKLPELDQSRRFRPAQKKAP